MLNLLKKRTVKACVSVVKMYIVKIASTDFVENPKNAKTAMAAGIDIATMSNKKKKISETSTNALRLPFFMSS